MAGQNFLTFATFIEEMQISHTRQADRPAQLLLRELIAVIVERLVEVISTASLDPIRFQPQAKLHTPLTYQHRQVEGSPAKVVDQHIIAYLKPLLLSCPRIGQGCCYSLS